MGARKIGDTLVVRVEKGEEIISFLAAIAKRENIRAASIQAIGAVRNVELGYFELQSRRYLRREFPADMELVCLMGNITWSGEEPVIHCHAVVSGEDYKAVGGHLFRAEVAVTAEVFIRLLEGEIIRQFDEKTSLKLMDI